MKTVSLELARKLKSNSYPQEESTFSWIETQVGIIDITFNDNFQTTANGNRFIAASPTADEILDQLNDVEFHGNGYFLSIGHSLDAKWQLDYRDENDGQLNAWVGDSLADLAAQAWIFLKSEKIL